MQIRSYTASGMHSVSGYLRAIDAEIIAALLEYQAAHGITGPLCEIGVHHGRLFFMLALARNANERAIAIDLFEDDAGNATSWHSGRNTALVTNAKRLKIPLTDEEIFKANSLDITADDILARTNGRIRFFSIDGGHNYTCVMNDLTLASRTMSDKCVIAVDDFFNREFPEVAFATYDFLKGNPTIVPFLLSSGKLYLAMPEMAKKYQDAALAACKDAIGSPVEFSAMMTPASSVIFLRHSNLRRLADYLRDLPSKIARKFAR